MDPSTYFIQQRRHHAAGKHQRNGPRLEAIFRRVSRGEPEVLTEAVEERIVQIKNIQPVGGGSAHQLA